MAMAIIIIIPIACCYPFFQKYFISGLTVGAVKGLSTIYLYGSHTEAKGFG